MVGDCIILQSGDKIPADGFLVDGFIKVDNSSLNGESEECKKFAHEDPNSVELSTWNTSITGIHSSMKPLCSVGSDGRWKCCDESRSRWNGNSHG